MSEFIALTATTHFDLETDVFLKEMSPDHELYHIAIKIFPPNPEEKLFTLGVKNSDFDGIFVNAQHSVHDGCGFSSTILYKVLSKIISKSHNIALWYGFDYEELNNVRSESEFLKAVEECFDDGSAECYVKFSRD